MTGANTSGWFWDFGHADYSRIWDLQKHLLSRRVAGAIPDTVLLGEHSPVITLGRGTHPENLLNPNDIPVIEIERGGDITYHGPGQLIAYPIFQLPEGRRDLHRYLRDLEEVLIRTLAHFSLEGVRNPGWTGAWVQGKKQELLKIASIGVAVRKWVTYHGVALNVTTDLSAFSAINPCGLESRVMTSLAQCLEVAMDGSVGVETVEMETVKHYFLQAFESVFAVRLSEAPDELTWL